MQLAICRDANDGQWLYAQSGRVLRATSLEQVKPLLAQLQAHRDQGGWAMGWVAYEAAPAFDPQLSVKTPNPQFPLAEFLLCSEAPRRARELAEIEGFTAPENRLEIPWQASISTTQYAADLKRIMDYLAAGDSYQINYTFALLAQAPKNFCPRAAFASMQRKQAGAYSSFFQSKDYQICSASPELFYQQDHQQIRCKPMKGTWARGEDATADELNRQALFNSEKDRAENLMIVDMIRNDLGKIAKAGTVVSNNVFEIETFPRVLQMTTEVSAVTNASIIEIFSALFPCASITGAPKRRSMQIIAELEANARGPYCGAMGFIGPERSQFAVGIRGLYAAANGELNFGVGSGITWYSSSQSEYQECLLKTNILNP